MFQALHIFKKDVRYLRYEIALVLLLAIVFAEMHASGSRAFNDSWSVELALITAVAFLIGRLVLAETIAGECQFWVTRPYDWKSLIGAKLLFIVVFVNVPVFLAQFFILLADGFSIIRTLPGLFWMQLMLFSFVSLPLVGVAALSSGIASFIFAQLVVLAVGFGIWKFVPSDSGGLRGVDWVRYCVSLSVLFMVTLAVLFIQYKSRRILLSRLLAVGGITLAALAFVAMPWPVALSVQSSLSKGGELGSTIHVGLGRESKQLFWKTLEQSNVAVHLPISMRGIPIGTEAQADAVTFSFYGPDGRAMKLSVLDCWDLKRGSVSASAVVISSVCSADRSFFDHERDRPLTLHASVYFTLFGNSRSEVIPLSDKPSNAPDGLQCYTDVVRAEWDVYCRAAFRWPARLVYAKLGRVNADSFAQFISYSPFPATLKIEPIETRWASVYASGPRPTVRDVTIIVKEPLAHIRRDFEANEVVLNELPVSSVSGVPAQEPTIP